MSSNEQKLYHNCYTRNSDGANIETEWDKGHRSIYGGTNNPFWNRKLHKERVRHRNCKQRLQDVTNRKKWPHTIPL